MSTSAAAARRPNYRGSYPIYTQREPDRALLDQIRKARTHMVVQAPFFGQIAMHLEVVEVAPASYDEIKTFATDGRRLFYNPTFARLLDLQELIFVFGHETLHAALEHTRTDRMLGRNPDLWNAAADYVINFILKYERVGSIPRKEIIQLYLDDKYKDMSVEEVYEKLLKDSPQPKDGDLMDVHMMTGSSSTCGTPNETDTDSKGDGPVYTISDRPATEGTTQEQREVADTLKQIVISTVKSIKAQGAGSVPAAIERMVEEWLETKVDWRSLLASEISTMFSDDYTFMRPSKRSWSTGGCILPGHQQDEMVRACIAIDASGSISLQEQIVFLSEVKGLFESYNNFEIHIWTFDTQVYSYARFTEENVADLPAYARTLKGGGGTDFVANYDFMKEQRLHPKQFVMFTDGYPNGSWGDPDYTDTIFIIKGSKVKAPFGKYAHYEEL